MSKEDDVGIRGDLTVLGSFSANAIITNTLTVNIIGTIADLDVTGNIDSDTLSTTGLATLESLLVTNTATLNTLVVIGIQTTNATVTNLATINDLDVTTNIDTATLATTGLATLDSLSVTNTALIQDLDVTTNIDTATLATTGLATLDSLEVQDNSTFQAVTTNALLSVDGGMSINGGVSITFYDEIDQARSIIGDVDITPGAGSQLLMTKVGNAVTMSLTGTTVSLAALSNSFLFLNITIPVDYRPAFTVNTPHNFLLGATFATGTVIVGSDGTVTWTTISTGPIINGAVIATGITIQPLTMSWSAG